MPEEKPNILIVEDDPGVAEMLEAYLNAHGYLDHIAEDGTSAIEACKLSRPDLVVLDIRLPDFDGYEVARRLRTYQRTSDIPIIFLTEKRDQADILQGLELRADDFITKPFDIQEFRLRVRNALKRYVRTSLTHPINTLPDTVLVDERLQECVHSHG